MSRRQTNTNRIRGPQSALTDFLASNNISAVQIRDTFEQRRQAAEQARQQAQQLTAQDASDGKENDSIDQVTEEEEKAERSEERKKRKREERAAIEKIKKSKEFKRRKSRKGDNEDGEPEDDESDEWLALDMLSKKYNPLPGQLENCEICEKRFTVTPYSKTGPDGGLLCTKCSKELRDEEKRNTKPKQKVQARQRRRQAQSNLLDGIVQIGPKSLVEHCVVKVAEHINDVQEFGDLPAPLLNRLSQILSKRRVITARTLNFFLRSDLDAIDIYDCAKLEEDEYDKIFSVMSELESVNLRNAGQLKDQTLGYMAEKCPSLTHLQLSGCNLVSEDAWRSFFNNKRRRLQSLKLAWLDNVFDDDTVAQVVQYCPNITRLKLKKCFKIGDKSLKSIGKLGKLEHLSLEMPRGASERELIYVVDKTGHNLKTLSLEGFDDVGDDFLEVVKDRCDHLSKFRLTDNSGCTNDGFINLFTGWSNPPLTFVDFSSSRGLEYDDPNGPDGSEDTEISIGLASEGLKALMEHSGSALRRLDISSCRHIDRDVFSEVFDGVKIYPELRDLNISFLQAVNDFLVGCIFKSCPMLTKLTAFGCFNVKDVRVPAGVALIGIPNAQESLIVQGDYAP